jgi:hypothetical protein
MYRPAREQRVPGLRLVEYVCVIVVLLAMVALFAWFASHVGGGVLNEG